MSLDKTSVAKIAKLSRIRINDDKQDEMASDLNNIMGFVEQLSQVNVEGVEPMTSVIEMMQRQRDDIISDGGYADDILENGPATDMGFFTVPKVVE